MKNELRIYCDVEWVEGRRKPELISVGLVYLGKPALYVEVTDARRLKLASDFVADMVISQFGHYPGTVKCSSDHAVGAAIVGQLGSLASIAGADGLCLVADYDVDVDLLQVALDASGMAMPCTVRLENVAGSVFDAECDDLWDQAYAVAELSLGLSRHHALVDAAALADVASRRGA